MTYPTPNDHLAAELKLHVQAVDTAHLEATEKYRSRFEQVFVHGRGSGKSSERSRLDAHEAAMREYHQEFRSTLKINLGNALANQRDDAPA